MPIFSSQYKKLLFIPAFTMVITFLSCHSAANTDPVHAGPNADTVNASPVTAPVVVAADDSLKMGVRDAIKDYPGVKATTDNGEITLTGDIARSKLQGLMMAINSLHPKKINNNLTVK